MTDNMISMWKDMFTALFNALDQPLVYTAFFGECAVNSAESFIEHMLFEFCKNAYYKNAPQYPLRHYLPNYDQNPADRMMYSRVMKYMQKYKDLNYSVIQKISSDPQAGEKFKAQPMDTIDARIDGYKLSEMDFFEISTVHYMELVKSIVECRIYSAKKVSNQHFVELFEDYDNWVEKLIERSKKSDEDMIFSTIAFFTFEWRYAIEYYYRLAEYMLEFDIESVDFMSTWLFTGTYRFDSVFGKPIGTDSRMIKNRIELIPIYYAKENTVEEIGSYRDVFLIQLTLRHIYMTMGCIDGGKYMDWVGDNVTVTDIASFFRDYDVFQIWQRKSFDNKKIKKLRVVLEESSTFKKTKNPDFRA